MKIFELILLLFLIICAVMVLKIKNLFIASILLMSYSLVMSIIWIILESPDLSITEASVGAGITSILIFITLKKTGGLKP